MTANTKPTWRCYFSEAAETATKGTDSETLVQTGKTPTSVQANNEYEAAAEFINQLSPGEPKAIFVLGKTDQDLLQPYIICKPVAC